MLGQRITLHPEQPALHIELANSGRWKEAQQMRTVGGQGPHLLRTSSKLHY